MYCSHCGMKLPDWAHYCERCGTRVRRVARGAAPSARADLRDALQQSEPAQAGKVAPSNEILHDAQASTERTAGSQTFTVNDAIRQELDTLTEPTSFGDLERFVWPLQQEATSSPEPTKEDAKDLVPPAMAGDEIGAAGADAVGQDEEPSQDAAAAAEYAAEDVADEAQGEASDAVTERTDEALPAEELEQEPPLDSEALPVADATEEELPAQEPEPADGQPEGSVTELQAPEDSSDASDEVADIWSTKHFERIDVGEDDFPTETYVPTYHRSVEDQRRIQETYALKKLPAHQKPQRTKLQRIVLAIVGAGVVVLSFVLTYPVLNWAMQDNRPALQETSQEPVHYVSKRRAKKIVRSLEGWWTTNRTFDGRYWRIKDGVLETYAADGNLTKKKKIKVDEIELAPNALEGVEGKGYYLHGIDFYLAESDANTLHAIDAEGEPDKEANLVRTDEPSFAKDAQ